MVQSYGNAAPYVAATTGRPLPTLDPTYRPQGPTEGWTCPTGCGYKARRQTFHLCLTPAEKTTTRKKPKDEVYTELSENDLARRFAPDDTPLGRELGRLAAEDPAVRRASDRLDDMVARVTRPDDHVIPSNLQTSTPAPAAPTAAEPVPTQSTGAAADGHASAGVEPASETVAKRQAVRAKVTQTSPNDLVITLRGPSIATRTTEVAALLNNLLADLNQDTQTPAPATPKRKRKPATGTTPRRGTTGGPGNSTGKLAGHDQAIVDRYNAGESCRQIAPDYDCTDVAIRLLLKRNGVTLRTAGQAQRGKPRPDQRALTPEQENQVIAAYTAGDVSMRDLADRFTCSEHTIRGALARHGVQPRPSGRRTTTPPPTTTGDTHQ